jgi:formate hydrogenlyase subunit 3/multisubunit Na+/H+ antiporter MnhD subunit
VLTLVVGAGLAVVQRDVKRMLAYSSINHAGFVLVGLQAASARGVSASLYYLFTYTFMVIGSFAVVTVMGGRGDRSHDLTSYRGLAARRPWLALSFAVLLLAQAGVPFTTGFLAKLQVVVAGVDANSVPLAVIAMVTAAVAAFFYLRVGVLMYSPLRPATAPPGLEPVSTGTGAEIVEDQWQGLDGISLGDGAAPAEGVTAGNGFGPGGDGEKVPGAGPLTTWPEQATWAGTERGMAVVTELNAELLLDRDAASSAPAAEGQKAAAAVAAETAEGESEELALPRVPVLTSVALALCVGVTVVFGVWPAPIVDFAHQATLLFIG